MFPGAEHSRFGHALGAMHLMRRILSRLQLKGTAISEEEMQAASAAILLHDIGHGPLSHALEGILIQHFKHEMMTEALLEKLNQEFNGQLDLTIAMFKGTYHRPFFHQLISSQLDADRLDYLERDSFYSGVREGHVGLDRLIETMVVEKDRIFVQKKGIYALENYIMARNLMYKQVYLHKTNLAADVLMHHIFERISNTIQQFDYSYALSPALHYFLDQKPSAKNGLDTQSIQAYTELDDHDLWFAVKRLQQAKDPLLSWLCQCMMNRQLFKVLPLSDLNDVDENLLRLKLMHWLKEHPSLEASEDLLPYLYRLEEVAVRAYDATVGKIQILSAEGHAVEFSEAADTESIRSLMQPVRKAYVIFPRGLSDAFIHTQGVINL